jgi:predicted Zn-dependent protease
MALQVAGGVMAKHNALFFGVVIFALLSSACGADEDNPAARIDLYLSGAPRLTIEVDYVAGKQPSTSASDTLVTGLNKVLSKPSGIRVQLDQLLTPVGSTGVWTSEQLHALAAETFDNNAGDDSVSMHALFVDGRYEKDTQHSRVLGLAWGNRHVVVFVDNVTASCSALRPKWLAQAACDLAIIGTWTHEIGHVIGLVNNGLTPHSAHEDHEHHHHCNNPECVMHWTIESEALTSILVDRLLGGQDTPLGFDQSCQADIAARRNGQPHHHPPTSDSHSFDP